MERICEHGLPALVDDGLARLLDSIPGVVFQYEMGSAGANRMIYVSPACSEIWGVTPDALYSDPDLLWKLIVPDDIKRLRAEFVDLLSGSQSRRTLEYRVVEPSGAVRHIQSTIVRGNVTAAGTILHGVAIDDTDRHTAMELKAAHDTLTRAAAMKDEFLACMSHELRTPLTSILGLTEALGEGVYGEVEELQRRSLNTIMGSARHLLELINDILDLSKIEAGMLELRNDSVAVAALCESSILIIREAAIRKRIKLESSVDPRCSHVRADPRRLKQILVNLLGNAVKFTPDSGSIGLEVQADPESGTIRFAVWDTGIGIAPEDQVRLFQPFVQVYAGPAKPFVGTGLGLSLVKKMTELHGGTVRIESQPGSGTRFTVELPWIPAIRPSTSFAQPHPAHEGRGLRVLLVEDSEPVIRTVADYLRSRKYEVTIARNGHLALECAFENRPDIVLMDGRMPGLSGQDVIRALKDHPHTKRVPILAVTAQAMPDDRETMLAAGAGDYLSKPFTLRALGEKIHNLLQSRVDVHSELNP